MKGRIQLFLADLLMVVLVVVAVAIVGLIAWAIWMGRVMDF